MINRLLSEFAESINAHFVPGQVESSSTLKLFIDDETASYTTVDFLFDEQTNDLRVRFHGHWGNGDAQGVFMHRLFSFIHRKKLSLFLHFLNVHHRLHGPHKWIPVGDQALQAVSCLNAISPVNTWRSKHVVVVPNARTGGVRFYLHSERYYVRKNPKDCRWVDFSSFEEWEECSRAHQEELDQIMAICTNNGLVFEETYEADFLACGVIKAFEEAHFVYSAEHAVRVANHLTQIQKQAEGIRERFGQKVRLHDPEFRWGEEVKLFGRMGQKADLTLEWYDQRVWRVDFLTERKVFRTAE